MHGQLGEATAVLRSSDRLVEHQDALFKVLVQRWGELFGSRLDVLPCDLTRTYFESDAERGETDLRQYGYSRARFKTMQMVDVRVPDSDGHELVLSRHKPGWSPEMQ